MAAVMEMVQQEALQVAMVRTAEEVGEGEILPASPQRLQIKEGRLLSRGFPQGALHQMSAQKEIYQTDRFCFFFFDPKKH